MTSPETPSADPRHAVRVPSLRTRSTAWLRKAHGWIGLWGATLGLLFGISGLWLNHRAVLPLRPALARSEAQIALPGPAPADAQAMAAWLASTLGLERPATAVRVEPAKPVAWQERPARARGQGAAASGVAAGGPPPLMQPEHWTFNFGGPRAVVQADYWVGNRSVSVHRTEGGLVGTLMNLHKGIGMPIGWILLVDTLAGSLILLSLSGLALWMLTHRRRTVGLAIFGAALAAAASLAIARL